jgi:hypothetical protein
MSNHPAAGPNGPPSAGMGQPLAENRAAPPQNMSSQNLNQIVRSRFSFVICALCFLRSVCRCGRGWEHVLINGLAKDLLELVAVKKIGQENRSRKRTLAGTGWCKCELESILRGQASRQASKQDCSTSESKNGQTDSALNSA